jgi:class 3 adenylate cyclase
VQGPRRPLAFIVRVDDDSAETRVAIDGPAFSIGRETDNNLALPEDRTISRHHCTIRQIGDELVVEDLHSTNGTFVNGHRIEGTVPLQPPTSLMVGHTKLAIVGNPDSVTGQVEAVMQNTYTAQDSIIIPATGYFSLQSIPSEAFMVVDLVGSTQIVMELGSDKFAKIVYAMGLVLERDVKLHENSFMKGTGDGFFACFPSAEAALDSAVRLSPVVRNALKNNTIQTSVALHWGMSIPSKSGDRTGNHVHAVFSMEKVRHENEGIEEELRTQTISDIIVMSDEFRSQLSEQYQQRTEFCGTYALKGYQGEMRIYRLLGQPEPHPGAV